MSLRDFFALYALVGLACAIAVFRRTRGPTAIVSALVTVALWPLWAPFALAPPRADGEPEKASPESTAVVGRVGRALSRIAAEVSRVASRLASLDALAEQGSFERAASAARLDELVRSAASDRAVATARLQHDSRVRLADLLEALRTQLLLARYEGSPADDASAIVAEVWARLEGLGAAVDPGGALAVSDAK